MRGGYQGRILEVNLTTGRMQELPITERYAQLHIGGRGLGARLLYEHARPGVDAFDPEQPLILLTGPLTGTFYPTANRLIALGKSPLTQAYGASLAGGFFAAELKFAGYDGLIFKGAAPEPVYLSVHNGKAELLPARHLWGTLVGDTVRALRMEHGDASVRVVACGPAGENRVRYASLMAEDRAAGRTGMGALMGAKGLKAVAVRGTLPIPLHDPQGCMALMAGFQAESRSNRGMQRFITHGTAGNVKKLNIFGILPTRNFQTAVFDGAPRIDGDLLIDEFLVRDTACFTCSINCTKATKVGEGAYAGAHSEGPEYETLYALGSNVGNRDLDSIIAMDRLCDELGLDSMSSGCSIAFAMECFERGLLTERDTGGIPLRFGDHQAIMKLLPMIAYKQGFGALLAEGVKRMSEQIGQGSEAFAIHAKGLELGGYDPRGVQGEGLSMATSERGGCHHWGGYTIFAETTSKTMTPFETKGKAELVKKLRIESSLIDSLTACSFLKPTEAYQLPNMAKALSLATGLDYTEEKLREIGERTMNVERCFNVREGLGRKDDILPKRLLKEALPEGPCQGQTVHLEEMLDDFYRLNGWDPQTTVPTEAKLRALKLDELADDLKRHGKLPC